MPSWVPPAVAVAPPLFEEQLPASPQPPQPEASPQAQGHWYYCTKPAGYYPYVDTCSRPWIAVQPTPR